MKLRSKSGWVRPPLGRTLSIRKRRIYIMKELGNLAIICARRSDVLLQVQDGAVTVHVGAGHERAALHSACVSANDKM